MYWLHHIYPARTLWDPTTSDDQLYSTSSVAAALGIGRNAIHRLPIPIALIHKKSRYYRRGDVIAWVAADAESGADAVLPKLRAATKADWARRSRSPQRRYGPRNKKKLAEMP